MKKKQMEMLEMKKRIIKNCKSKWNSDWSQFKGKLGNSKKRLSNPTQNTEIQKKNIFLSKKYGG